PADADVRHGSCVQRVSTVFYPLSLHDALPICLEVPLPEPDRGGRHLHELVVRNELERRFQRQDPGRLQDNVLIRAGRPDVRELRSEEHTSELQSRENLVCRLLLEKKNPTTTSS